MNSHTINQRICFDKFVTYINNAWDLLKSEADHKAKFMLEIKLDESIQWANAFCTILSQAEMQQAIIAKTTANENNGVVLDSSPDPSLDSNT